MKSSQSSRKKLLRQHLALRLNLCAKAVGVGDVRTAFACLDSAAKMLGLYPDQAQECRQLLDEINKQIAVLENLQRANGAAAGTNGEPPHAGD